MRTIIRFRSFIGNLFITATSVSQQRDLIFSKYCSCLKNCLLYCYLEIKGSLSSLVRRHLDRVVVSPISIKTYSFTKI